MLYQYEFEIALFDPDGNHTSPNPLPSIRWSGEGETIVSIQHLKASANRRSAENGAISNYKRYYSIK
jgi:hypothetical protein